VTGNQNGSNPRNAGITLSPNNRIERSSASSGRSAKLNSDEHVEHALFRGGAGLLA
jgi:hypothetical protein